MPQIIYFADANIQHGEELLVDVGDKLFDEHVRSSRVISRCLLLLMCICFVGPFFELCFDDAISPASLQGNNLQTKW